jgi:cobalt-zinc-cadmium efflux system protein
VHHVHIWTVGTREWALSGHVVVHAAALRDGEAVVDRTQHMLEDRFGIAHSTIQMESDALPDDDPGPEPPNSPL